MVNKYDPKDIVKYVADQLITAQTVYERATKDDNKYEIGLAMTSVGQCGVILSRLAIKMNGGKKQQKVL